MSQHREGDGIMISRRNVVIGLTAFATAGDPLAAADPCAQYYGKGYCTDYVNGKISPQQRGDGGSWPSNTPGIVTQRGDVAILRSKNHVAYVEEVTARDSAGNATAVRISEMNWGPLKPRTPSGCFVTTKFGVRSERTIKTSSAEFMRPGGYRPKAMPKKLNLPSTPIDTRTAGSTPPISGN